MRARELLERCRAANRDIRRMQEKINRLHKCAMRTSSFLSPVSGGGVVSDRYGGFAADIDDAERELKERREQHESEMLACCKLLEKLPELECAILHRFYVLEQTLGQIAKKQGYTVGYCKRRKSEGLRMLNGVSAEEIRALLPPWYE